MDKITEQDLANRGVKGLPDVPGLTTEEMQRKLEEIAREILIPKVNELVEGLNNANSNLEHIISDSYKYHVPASELGTTGWKSPNINQNLSIPDGYSFAGIFAYIGTYKIAAIQPVVSAGTVSFTFYLLAALSNDIDIVWRAVFKKI